MLTATTAPLIGPWGWLGWVCFIVMAVLYVRLWQSSGSRNLRRLNIKLAQATETIAKLHEETLTLQTRNDVLRRQIERLEDAQTRHRNQLVELAKGNDYLRNLVKELAGKCKALEERMDIMEAERNTGKE